MTTHRFIARLPAGALLLTAAFAASNALAGGIAYVTNGNDSGPGSLRDALEVQQASIVDISRKVKVIEIASTLTYAGQESLYIEGSGQTITTAQNVTLLAVTEGADLKLRNLDFVGPGGFSITNRGAIGQSAGKGIFIDVREDQTGSVTLHLDNVSVSGVANHGIHVSDCSLADACGAGAGGGGEGSPAGIVVIADRVKVFDVGQGKFDADGLRVDDRGAGGITALIRRSSFTGVGADGVELDEGNEGSVDVLSLRNVFSNNGSYCDPALLEAFLPEVDEAESTEAEQVTDADIPLPITGTPDDACIEQVVDRYDSGFIEAYEVAIDVDDGIDLDEAGDGDLLSRIVRTTINDNFDEGVDYDEAGDGSIDLRIVRSSAKGNTDDGFKFSEEDGGDVTALVSGSFSKFNGGKGFVFEEEGDGDLDVTVLRSITLQNDDSDATGIEAVQEDGGVGTLKVRKSNILDGIDLDGVEEI